MRRHKSPTADPGKPSGPATAKLPKSPYAATTAGQLGKNDAPPKRYEVLKPNLDVEPQPRKAGGDASLTAGTPKGADKTVPQNQPPKKDSQSLGGAKGPKPSGQQNGASKDPQKGPAGGPQSGSFKDPQNGPVGGQQPRTAGGQEKGASPGQQNVNPQNQTPGDSTKKDKK